MQALTKQTLKIFWQHTKRYKWQASFVIFGMLAHTVLQSLTPVMYQMLIDSITQGSKDNLEPMLYVVKLILFVSLFRMVVARSFNYVNNFLQPRVMADLENTCYEYLQKHSYGFFLNNFMGSLVTKVKRYERAFETIADQITFDLGRSILDLVTILIILFYTNTSLGLITLVWAVIYLIFSYVYSLYKLPVDIKRAEADSQVTAQLADSLTNNTNVKIFAGYNFENANFKNVTNHQFRIRKRSWDLGTTSELIQAFTMIILEFIAFYICVHLWSQSQITIGTIVLVQTFYVRLFDKFWSMGKNIRATYEAIADANEMTEILNTPWEVKDAVNAKTLQISKGEIEFNNVNFTYEGGSKVLQNFNLKIPAGQKVALVGPSGGGKSTLVKLILRFNDLQKGHVLIDSQDIKKVTQDSLRNNVALVPQEPILFHRTLLENIRYGKPDATDEEVYKAAKLAHAHEFIVTLKEGYGTYVGERGIKLSGGQRQRVAIARAILKNAPILILDEATSSLDSENEMLIQDALKHLMRDKTVIVIAHRLSTIMQMDRIIVLENGKITEEGMHTELVKAQQGTYQRLWNIQAGGFIPSSS